MPITSAQYTVSTTATEICAPDIQPMKIWVHNDERDDAHDVYLGNGDVSSSTGLHLTHEQTIMLTLDPGDSLHAISTHLQGAAVHVLIQKQD